MWHTPLGDRVIRGAEADLIRASIDVLADEIQEHGWDNDDLGFSSGIEVFDELTWTHKLAAIEQVARYLLTDTVDVLPLSAINEAVVGAIFENAHQMVEYEIAREAYSDTGSSQEDLICADETQHDDADDYIRWHWRDLVIKAVLETITAAELSEMYQEGHFLPTSTCTDHDTWSNLVENLADQILWDRDYELAAAFMDDDPVIAAAEKKIFGIDQDYFTDLPPDPREDQMQRVVISIHDLVRTKPR